MALNDEDLSCLLSGSLPRPLAQLFRCNRGVHPYPTQFGERILQPLRFTFDQFHDQLGRADARRSPICSARRMAFTGMGTVSFADMARVIQG